MAELPVRAYTDSISYERGQTINVHVSAADPVNIRLNRMRSSDAQDTTLDAEVEWAYAGTYKASAQETFVGSFLQGDLSTYAPVSTSMLSMGAFVWSSDFDSAGTQTIMALESGPALKLVNGCAAIVLPGNSAPLLVGPHLENNEWHFVVASLGENAKLTVLPMDALRGASGDKIDTLTSTTFQFTGAITVGARNARRVTKLKTGACGSAEENFNGKIEDPFLSMSTLESNEVQAIVRGEMQIGDINPVAWWDLSFRYGEDLATATACAPGQPDGLLVNGPARAVTGRRFSGRHLDFNLAPREYGAAHFHATDLIDAGWETAVSAPLPEYLASGVYGVVVENASGSDTVPIVVVPQESDPRNKVLVVLPTFTYLAYANEALFNGLDTSAMTDAEVTLEDVDQAHVGDRSFGVSMYDTHPDGSGVITSSARRQIINMRRGYRMWLVDAGRSFSSDMYLIEWLARRGIDVDVVTDYEIHRRGASYLAPYAALISGSHPEYTTEEMLDALTAYRDTGGALLYLGGNGWYWVTGLVSNDPLVVEIRRGHAGIRTWESLPGEVTLMSTGLPGGLWRHRGRAPQRLCGVGMAAQGWGQSEPYYRSASAVNPQWEWVFTGVDEDPIGNYGEVMGGAAGDEIDRADQTLGTPPHAVILASSRDHTNFYQRALEEIPMNLPDHGGGQQDPEVRADIVYFKTPAGGEVFSTGSIAFSGALLHNNTENGVSRMTENVIRTFLDRRAGGQP